MQEFNEARGGPPPFPRSSRPVRPRRTPMNPKALLGYVAFLLVASGPLVFWFGFRIEPRAGEIAVLTRKTGEDLPSGQILALHPGQKGIQLEVLPEGRYFRNPFFWDWEIDQITDIPAGKLGVQTRLYGEDLPPGRIIAGENTKGIMADILRPGKYRINPYAYEVDSFEAITIRPGHVGVVTDLVGEDVLHADPGPEFTNEFIVEPGRKGVVEKVLDPGTYYLNPYLVYVTEVNLQSQRFEMSGEDVITFLTLDGFTVTVEGTIEFSLQREHAARLTHRVGDMDDIIKKIILPRARGFSRIEGSKHPAINYIVGQTRQQFQNVLENHLRDKCDGWGVSINSVLVRKIIPPDDIAAINRDREVAVQESAKFTQQIEQAKSKAELVKQETLAIQNKEKVEADTVRIRAVIDAERGQAVKIIAAEKDRDVAQVRFDAAQFQAQAILLTAEGQRDAIRVKNVAEANVLRQQVDAFGSGMQLARYTLYQRVAPRLMSVLASDQGGGLGAIFTPFLPDMKGGAQ